MDSSLLLPNNARFQALTCLDHANLKEGSNKWQWETYKQQTLSFNTWSVLYITGACGRLNERQCTIDYKRLTI